MNETPRRAHRTGVKRYIALEGIDGAGKTSVLAGLAEHLEYAGQEVVCVREPGGTKVGESLRDLLLEGPPMSAWAEALMFAADRAQLVEQVVRPALARSAWVLSDRSVYSSLAYQGAGRGLGMDRVRQINEPGLAGTWPDLVVLLVIGPEAGLARQEKADRIGSEGSSILPSVAQAFERLASEEPDKFVVIDAEQSLERVIGQVWAALPR